MAATTTNVTGPTDLSSLSNFAAIRTEHIQLDWTIDWTKQLIHGSATLTMKPTKSGIDRVVLDTSYLDISGIKVDGEAVKYTLAERIGTVGSALTIHLPIANFKEVKVTIAYSTTEQCTALGWMTEEQTKGGKFPYLYSQCQAIHARSLFPCQDTPYIKTPYSAHVRSTIPVLMSALRVSPPVIDGPEGIHAGKEVGKDIVEYVYDQPIGIPSYLVAIAAGNLMHRSFPKIEGKSWHTGVWTEPEGMDAAYWEFSADTANFVATAESITSPYVWTQYDLLLLPDSFPYGGMENACISYMTPTLLAGDRSLVDVCAHEISHSWFGNGIGCANWGHFWLNEGWTTYTENLIELETHGEQSRALAYIIGRKALRDALKEMPTGYQSLVIDYKEHADPDDAFSTVPYEKGSNFLLHLERQVGGLSVFRPYIKAYVAKFSGQSITTEQWRSHLYEYFGGQNGGDEIVKKLDAINWDGWLHGTGPDLIEDMKYDETLAKQCYNLADRWDKARNTPTTFSPSDFANLTPSQRIVFLETLQDLSPSLPANLVAHLDEVYGVDKSKNAEIKLRFYGLALKSGDAYAEKAAAWVADKGRMKMCRTIYRALYKVAPELAVKTFKAHEKFYHPIARRMIQKDLELIK